MRACVCCAQFGHNPSNHSILLRSALFNVVLLCRDVAEHREWRKALLRLQTEINESEEQSERQREAEERERQRAEEDEEARRLIAKRKLDKLERRRSAEYPLSSSLPNQPNHLTDANALSPSPNALSAAPVPPPLESLSPASRSQSDVTVSPSAADRRRTWTENAAIAIGQHNDNRRLSRFQRMQLHQHQQQTASLSDTDEEGSGSGGESEERGVVQQLDSGPLMARRASTRSMSLDESEMSQMRASRMGSQAAAAAVAVGGSAVGATLEAAEPGATRKLTDPLPSAQPSAVSNSFPTVVQQREKQQAARDDEERARRAEAYLRQQKSRAYIKLFNLPDSEELVVDYSCAVQRAILLHGRMYVSEHFVCFFSSIFSHKTSIVLPMDDVLFVASAKVALVFDNSLKVHRNAHRAPRTQSFTHSLIHSVPSTTRQ